MAVDRLCGATIRRYPAGPDTNDAIADLADRVEASAGRRPHIIPVGGSNAIGALGFVRAGLELAHQVEDLETSIDAIVVASGSGGTQAGLVVGLALAGLPTRVIGVSVARREPSLRRIVGSLCDDLAAEVGLAGIDWDAARDELLVALLEHEAQHQGQLIRYGYARGERFPDSWAARWSLMQP